MQRARRRPITATWSLVIVATMVLSGPACSDDKVVDTTPTGSTTTVAGDSPLDAPGSHDASVIVRYTIADGSGSEGDAIAELEEQLVDAIEPDGIGVVDGDEFGEGEVRIFMYGPDLDRLWETVEPIVTAYPARPADAELRDGGPEQPAKRIDLGPAETAPSGSAGSAGSTTSSPGG